MGQFQLDPPQRLRMVDAIIEQIVRQIQNGTLAPGQRLPSERELVRMSGVSRATVREALHALQAMNLIEGQVGRGTFVKSRLPASLCYQDVANLTLALQKEMRQYFTEARLTLEREIVRLACHRMTEGHRRAVLEATERNAQEDSWESNTQLHIAIAEATGNPVLVHMLHALLDAQPRSVFDKGYEDAPSDRRPYLILRSREIHRRLGESVAYGDAKAAQQAIEEHAALNDEITEAYFANRLNGRDSHSR